MFISRRAYQDLQDRITKAEATATAQIQSNQMLEASMNWFRHRLTQIEAERAVLIYKVMGVKVPAPMFDVVPTKKNLIETLTEADIFKGMSDAEAEAHGIGWDNDGRLVEKT